MPTIRLRKLLERMSFILPRCFDLGRQRKRGLTRYNGSGLIPPVHPDRRVRVTFVDGRSPGSRVSANHRLPGFPVAFEAVNSPLTVAGAAAAQSVKARYRVPFLSLYGTIRR